MSFNYIFFKNSKQNLTVVFLMILLAPFHFLLAQDKDTLDQQVVNVVKPYQPKVADAFKIKEIPKLDDSLITQKKPIKYTIFSIPVASTFTPAKAKAATVKPEEKQRVFNNYASLGVGSYTTILGELFVNHQLNDSENIGAYINHHSSNGAVPEVVLDNDFSISQADLFFTQNQKQLNWKFNAGIDLRTYNWYGTRLSLTQNQIDNLDTKQNYSTFYGGGILNFEDGIINKIDAKFTHFNDDFNSSENRFNTAFNLNLPVLADGLSTKISFDYLDGEFSNETLFNNTLNYGNVILGISPSIDLIQGDLHLNLGAQISYLNDFESDDNKFFFYPHVNASFPLVEESLEIYAGVNGGLMQNSYHQFAHENPFLSPTLFISPTDKQYHGFLGFRGKLSNSVNYNLKGSYTSEKNRALFQSNYFNLMTQPSTFLAGNSFAVVYDDVKTFNISGEFNIDINQNFSLGLTANYFNYNTNNFEYAWNLPDVTGSLRLDYQISKDWFSGASIFYTGDRKDLITTIEAMAPLISIIETQINIDGFIDANAHVGYRINNQFTAFVKGNNLSGQNYEQWTSYPVQGIQILGGVIYQFDF